MADIITFENFRYNPQSKRIEGYDEQDVEMIRQAINRFGLVMLRRVFEKAALVEIRKRVFEFFLTNPESNPSIDVGSPNYWRLDDNPPKAAVKRVDQFFSSFYWNDDLAGEKPMMQAMSRLKNRIARLPDEFALTSIEEGYVTYPTIKHYPRGGGRLNKHIDPQNIQFCVIIASMSARGQDYDGGGVYVEQDGEKIDVDGLLDVGDIYLAHPGIVHGVDPIDRDAFPAKWKEIDGRWIMFPSLIEVKTTQGVKVAGLADLDSPS